MIYYLNKYPNVDFVYANYYEIDEKDNITGLKELYGPNMLIYRCCIGAIFLYNRKVYNEVGEYDPELYLVEDYDYWIRVHKKFKMKRINKYLGYVRYHP
jgi:hypothetical protein